MEVPEGVPVEEKSEASGSGDRTVFIDTRKKVPKDFYIGKKGCGETWVYERLSGMFQLVQGIGEATA